MLRSELRDGRVVKDISQIERLETCVNEMTRKETEKHMNRDS